MNGNLLPWHLTGCGDVDLYPPHNYDIFRINLKKCLILVIKQLLTILTNPKEAKEIDYFEMLIFLNIEENTSFRSQDESS